ncbi:ABC transporter substrate-binding protein [Arthrobacter sp. NPDC090010]|uniref:ABC transporter substrate-binding protein n=1 Tax=Arthrobacter sp. NPDC090010 TaxID=3363942 RepID=UPI00381F723C
MRTAVPDAPRSDSLTPGDADAEFLRIIAALTRRGFLSGGLGAAAVLGLAACGNATPSAVTSQGSRRVRTSSGEVEVPEHPERVIAGTAWAVNTLLDLGITPVGSFRGARNVVLPGFREKMGPVADISGSDGNGDDLEKVAALKPDLIITFATSESLAGARQIAPVIGQDSVHEGWEELCAQVADAVNKAQELTALKVRFEARLESLRKEYADVFSTVKWYVVQAGDTANPATLYAPANTEAGVIIKRLGGSFGSAEEGTHYGDGNTVGEPLSGELLPKLADGDAIIVWDNGDAPSPDARSLYAQKFWKELPAVKNGAVFRTSMPGSYGSASGFLDLLEEACRKLRPTGK